MHFALIGHVQTIWLFQWTLFVRINHDVALDALLSHVGPAVAAHPLPLALGALVLPKATLLALVWCQTLTLRARLRAVLDVVSLVEAQVAQVGAGRTLARLTVQRQLVQCVCKIHHAPERRRTQRLRARALKGVGKVSQRGGLTAEALEQVIDVIEGASGSPQLVVVAVGVDAGRTLSIERRAEMTLRSRPRHALLVS